MRNTPFLTLGIFSLLILSSCHQIAPGMKIDESRCGCLKFIEIPACGRIQVIPITPELICDIEEESRTYTLNAFDAEFSVIKTDPDYLIAPADALSIMVWGHPELNNPTNSSANFEQLGFIVNSKGTIFYPYVGEVKVAGCTVDAVREIIADNLKEIVIDPMVNVSVLQYRSQFVNVIGEVNLPSQVPITDVPIKPIDAVSLAGGATFRGDLQHVIVKRKEELCVFNLLPKEFSGDCNHPQLMHGDVVYVPNKINNQVYVLGEVLLPQAIVMDSDTMTLSEALARSSGVDPFSSNPELLFVFRGDNQGNKIAYHLNANSPAALLLANSFPLQRQDIVYVGTYEPAFLNRIMTNFLSTTKAVADLSWSASNINEVINKYNRKSYNNNSSSAYINDFDNN